MANIAVYSGSFNPLHIGHLAIIRHLIEEADFDMVYLIVSPKNPLKDSISSDSAAARYNAAIAAINRHFSPLGDRGGQTVATRGHVSGCHDLQGVTGWRADDQREEARKSVHSVPQGTEVIKVDDIELTMPEPNYTIRTLDALREREPDNDFTFVMGADSLGDIRRWKDYTRILKEFGVAVFPRTGFDLEALRIDLLEEDPAYKITLLNAEMVDISSTTIREAIASGQDISSWLM
jgi:nicotinate-nucleotide adenylyltransferase